MNQANDLMGLYARTSLHPGAGAGDGVIDLPIQREAHSGWPCVYGSGVKGALRHHAQAIGFGDQGPDIDAVFGPEHAAAEGQPYAGALLVGDARLVLLPVRSLTSCFRQLTCPALLNRLRVDARRLGLDLDGFHVPGAESGVAHVAKDTRGDLFLEEYRFTTESSPELNTTVDVLARLAPEDSAEEIRERLTVINDDEFSFLAEHATPVNPHTSIEPETKTVKNGALWYEETLPPDTLLVCSLGATKVRREKAPGTADDVLNSVRGLFREHPFLQVGGNETVGMGWCELRFDQGARA